MRKPKYIKEPFLNSSSWPEGLPPKTQWPKIVNYTTLDTKFLLELQETVYRLLAFHKTRYSFGKKPNYDDLLSYCKRVKKIVFLLNTDVFINHKFLDGVQICNYSLDELTPMPISNALSAIIPEIRLNKEKERNCLSRLIRIFLELNVGRIIGHTTVSESVHELLESGKIQILLRPKRKYLGAKKKKFIELRSQNFYRTERIARIDLEILNCLDRINKLKETKDLLIAENQKEGDKKMEDIL